MTSATLARLAALVVVVVVTTTTTTTTTTMVLGARVSIDTATAAAGATSYRTPPRFVEEFSANVLQHKWNDQAVNHSYVSVLYSSVAHAAMRTDTLLGGQNVNGGARSPSMAISLLDYSHYPDYVLNTFWERPGLSRAATCTVSKLSPLSAFPPPAVADQLARANATFAGAVPRVDLTSLEGNGPADALVERWTQFLPQPTAVTYLFNEATHAVLGYDFTSPVLRTGVTTKFYDVTVGPLDPSIFAVDDPACVAARAHIVDADEMTLFSPRR